MDEEREYTHLPLRDRREWLLDRLGDLVERAGVEPLVSWPLIEPDGWFFPDRWDPADDKTIERLLRRLLWYAGLDELDVALHVVDEPARDTRARLVVEPEHSEAVAWYAGIEDNTCHFGLYRARLTTGDEFAAAMAHEVAHAYRHVHGLEVAHSDTEEQLTDLTTVYLGTGVLSTNGAYRYRSSSTGGGAFAGHQWQHKRLGYLGHDSLAFLLAARCHLLDLDKREVRRVADLLELTQRACFIEAMTYFDELDESLAHRLRLAPRDQWPPLESAEALVAWDGSEDPRAPSDAPAAPVHSAVERVDVALARERDRALPALGAGVLASIVAAVAFDGEWRAVLFAVPFVSFVAGQRRKRYLCGGPDCHSPVTIGQRCPRCDALALNEEHPWS